MTTGQSAWWIMELVGGLFFPLVSDFNPFWSTYVGHFLTLFRVIKQLKLPPVFQIIHRSFCKLNLPAAALVFKNYSLSCFFVVFFSGKNKTNIPSLYAHMHFDMTIWTHRWCQIWMLLLWCHPLINFKVWRRVSSSSTSNNLSIS